MTMLFVFLILALFFSAAIIVFEFIKDTKIGSRSISSILALSILIFLVVVIAQIPSSGEPATKIDPGSYKVVSVYEAGPNVNLGLEIEGEKDGRHFRAYRFPKEAFVGNISKTATVLHVVEAEGFKRLVLE